MAKKDTPLTRYKRDLAGPGFQRDVAQEQAVQRLDTLYTDLLQKEKRNAQLSQGVFGRIWQNLVASSKPVPPVKGVYLWGGVGRGKTYLMDAFFETLPLKKKMRTHFHRFMRRVHQEMAALKNEKNPLDHVAEKLSSEADVICFDEFFVSDITDAMILANLLQGLFDRGVCLVATSNIVPDGLYRDGLQRQRFLPAIALLNAHLDILNVDGGVDYRLRALKQAALYYAPLASESEVALQACFERLVIDSSLIVRDKAIEVEGRSIGAVVEAEDVVWFDFEALCDGPRSQNDYIVLAKEYHAVIVSGVPCFDGQNDDQARRFIYMVDEFYDRQVKLVLSAAAPIDGLYLAGKLGFEFERTMSRLLEMQSEEYLASAHRA